MADFAIIRVKKLKTLAAVSHSARHCYRERDTPNADPERTPKNASLVSGTSEAVVQGVRGLLPEKHRKDAVRCLEYLVTASPTAFNRPEGGMFFDGRPEMYFKESLEWLKQRHGSENIVAAEVHNDESTPHMTVYVVPKVDGKLNAKHFCGGSRKLAQLQTDFAADVGAKYGVGRGKARKIGDDRVRHVTIQQYYEDLERKHQQERAELEAGRCDLAERQSALNQRQQHIAERENALLVGEGRLKRGEAELARRTEGTKIALQVRADDVAKLEQLAATNIEAAYAKVQTMKGRKR